MKYVDEYRDRRIATGISRAVGFACRPERRYNFMEVCGTHTNTFFKFGLKTLIPENIRLLSGPGCPVCVTDVSYMDNVIRLSGMEGIIIATFGDMIRVPGTHSSLYKERTEGRDIKIVYSSLDALKIAETNPSKKVVFLAVGFETTSPTVALTLIAARKRRVRNFYVYVAHKLIPPAIRALLKDKDFEIDGFILPAHVSAIVGVNAYGFLDRMKIPAVIAGFEPLDMLQGIKMLIDQVNAGNPEIQIQYNRVVKRSGNKWAQKILNDVFEIRDEIWRGFGRIPKSGLKIRDEFEDFDAEIIFDIKKSAGSSKGNKDCICGDVLKGKRNPSDCRLFRRSCSPQHPKGPCMVSSEGSCSVYYKYGGDLKRGR